MFKYYLSIFSTAFLLSGYVIAMDGDIRPGSACTHRTDQLNPDYYINKLVKYLDKQIGQSKHHGQVFQYTPILDLEHGLLKVAITFTDKAKDEKSQQTILKFLTQKANAFFKKSQQNAIEKPPVMIKKLLIVLLAKEDKLITKNVLDTFAINLFKTKGQSLEKWLAGNNFRDDSEKLIALQQIFQELIFTNGLAKHIPDLKDANNLCSCALFYSNIFDNIITSFKQHDQKISDSIDKFYHRVLSHVKATKNYEGNQLVSYNIDIQNLLEEILAQDYYASWSKLQSLSQFAHDGLDSQNTLLKIFRDLHVKLLALSKYNSLIEQIIGTIKADDQAKLVFFSYVKNANIWENNCVAVEELISNIAREIGLIEKNIDFFTQVISPVDLTLLGMSLFKALTYSENSSPNPPTSGPRTKHKSEITPKQPDEGEGLSAEDFPPCPAQEKSATSQCHAQAQEQIAKENARAAKKKSRTNNSSTCESTQDDIGNVAHCNKLQIYHNKDQTLSEIKPELLINNSEIYIDFGFACPSVKINTFIETGKRLKIIKQDSLGQNGLKIYGLNFLVVKNKQFPSEHLLFVSHPIDQGNSGHVFIPYKLVSHNFYEKLLNEPQLLKSTLESARSQITVSNKK